LACPGCINEDVVNKTNSFSKERLMELGEEFIECGVKAVILIGGGEPLTHPKTGDFITLMGENDIHIGITTNGTFIDRFINQISEYSSWTRVSMDAATDNIFKIVRPTKGGKSKFNKVINNMRMLAKSKKGTLGYSYLVQTKADGAGLVSNIHEIYNAAVLAKDIGCDYFEVKPTYQWRDGVDHSLMKHDPKLMEEAKVEIARLDDLESENFKIMKAINLEYSLNGEHVEQVKTYKSCPSVHLRTTVTPSGVYVCPYWRGKAQKRVGNVNQVKFSDMWDGSLRKQVMDGLDVSVDCASIHCLRHETNNKCIEIKNNLENNQVIPSIADFDRFI
jgi:MoaA/NifB/PqqE/SkfB family radical SAM enzyme